MPSGWKKDTLENVLDKIIDYRGQSVPKAETGIPLITARNVREGHLDFSAQEFVDESEYDNWMTRGMPQSGDVLITTEAPLGMVAMYPRDNRKYAVGQRTVTLRPSQELDSKFLMYYLLGPGNKEIQDRATGSTAKGIKSSELRKVSVTFPQKNEQEKIAKILSTWDEAIEKHSVILRKKEQKYQISLNEIFGKSKANTSWLESSLESVSLKITDGAHSSPPSFDGGRPMLSVKDMREFEFDLSQPRLIGEKHYQELVNLGCKPEVGDVLIAKDGSVLKYIFEVKQPVEAVLLSSIAIIRPNPNLINPSFLAHFFRRDNFKEYVRRELTSGSGVPRIVLRDFRKIKIHVPDLPTQRKIVGLLDAFILEISLTGKIIDLLKCQKQGLMQQLLTGKKRVKV